LHGSGTLPPRRDLTAEFAGWKKVAKTGKITG
jgi:hypothetical protein